MPQEKSKENVFSKKMEQEKLYDFSPPFPGSSFMLHPSSLLLSSCTHVQVPQFTLSQKHTEDSCYRRRTILSSSVDDDDEKQKQKTKEKVFHVVLIPVAVFGTFFFPPQFELLDFHLKVFRCLFIFTFSIARRCKELKRLPKWKNSIFRTSLRSLLTIFVAGKLHQ